MLAVIVQLSTMSSIQFSALRNEWYHHCATNTRCPCRTGSAVSCTAVSHDDEADEVANVASSAVRQGLQRGLAAMRLRVALVPLDPVGSNFQPATFARFTLRIAEALVGVTGPGRVVVLLPGPQTCSAAVTQLGETADWSYATRHRVSICAHSLEAPPLQGGDATNPAAVLVAGISPSSGADDPSVKLARRWLDLSREGTVPVVCLNARFSRRAEPVELRRYATVFALVKHMHSAPGSREAEGPASALEDRTSGEEGDADVAVSWLMLAYPGPWRVMMPRDPTAHAGCSPSPVAGARHGAFEEIAVLDERPSAAELERIVSEAMVKRQVAEEAMVEAIAPALVGPWQATSADVTPSAELSARSDRAAPRSSPRRSLDAPALAIGWEEIDANRPIGGGVGSPLAVYASACLLRLHGLPKEVARFDEDREAVHVVLRGDGLVSKTGAALGACVLYPSADGKARSASSCRSSGGGANRSSSSSEGAGRIAQLVIDASAGRSSGRYAARLLAQVDLEARRQEQRWLVYHSPAAEIVAAARGQPATTEQPNLATDALGGAPPSTTDQPPSTTDQPSTAAELSSEARQPTVQQTMTWLKQSAWLRAAGFVEVSEVAEGSVRPAGLPAGCADADLVKDLDADLDLPLLTLRGGWRRATHRVACCPQRQACGPVLPRHVGDHASGLLEAGSDGKSFGHREKERRARLVELVRSRWHGNRRTRRTLFGQVAAATSSLQASACPALAVTASPGARGQRHAPRPGAELGVAPGAARGTAPDAAGDADDAEILEGALTTLLERGGATGARLSREQAEAAEALVRRLEAVGGSQLEAATGSGEWELPFVGGWDVLYATPSFVGSLPRRGGDPHLRIESARLYVWGPGEGGVSTECTLQPPDAATTAASAAASGEEHGTALDTLVVIRTGSVTNLPARDVRLEFVSAGRVSRSSSGGAILGNAAPQDVAGMASFTGGAAVQSSTFLNERLWVTRSRERGEVTVLRRTDAEALQPPSRSLFGKVYSLRYTD